MIIVTTSPFIIFSHPVVVSETLLKIADDLFSRSLNLDQAQEFAGYHKASLSYNDYKVLAAAYDAFSRAFNCCCGNDDLWFGESLITHNDILKGFLKLSNVFIEEGSSQ